MKADNRNRDRTKDRDHAHPYFSWVLVHLLLPRVDEEKSYPLSQV